MTYNKILSAQNESEVDKYIRQSPDWVLNVVISQGGTNLIAKATAEKESRNKDYIAANTIAGVLAGFITSIIINILWKH